MSLWKLKTEWKAPENKKYNTTAYFDDEAEARGVFECHVSNPDYASTRLYSIETVGDWRVEAGGNSEGVCQVICRRGK